MCRADAIVVSPEVPGEREVLFHLVFTLDSCRASCCITIFHIRFFSVSFKVEINPQKTRIGRCSISSQFATLKYFRFRAVFCRESSTNSAKLSIQRWIEQVLPKIRVSTTTPLVNCNDVCV